MVGREVVGGGVAEADPTRRYGVWGGLVAWVAGVWWGWCVWRAGVDCVVGGRWGVGDGVVLWVVLGFMCFGSWQCVRDVGGGWVWLCAVCGWDGGGEGLEGGRDGWLRLMCLILLLCLF